MLHAISTLLLGVSLASAQVADPQLTGTWSTKSNSTFTGPGFYNPAQEHMIEPSHTGISYSFTDDGFWESAYYQALPNPVEPSCPKAIMQWQHGSFQISSSGSLQLVPISVDGRQLTSDPCNSQYSVMTRENTTETFQRYELLTDPFHNIPRLNLYRFDGSPLPAMYLAFKPPTMLPTSTLNPTKTATATGAKATAKKVKRMLGLEDYSTWSLDQSPRGRWLDPNSWWWFGIGVTGLGGFLFICF